MPGDTYYGAQSARSLINFDIGTETLPRQMIRAFGIVKKVSSAPGRRGREREKERERGRETETDAGRGNVVCGGAQCACKVNMDLGNLDTEIGSLVAAACDEVSINTCNRIATIR